MFSRLKYPLAIFLALLAAKLVYIIVESYYHHHILMMVSDSSVSRAEIEQLNEYGHRIASAGLTLLIFPLLFQLLKASRSAIKYPLLGIILLLSYFTINASLNHAVDKIVESQADKRYQAYYIEMFKYGVLNNIFKYDSFLNNERVNAKALTLDDRIVVANAFTLTFADAELVNRLNNQGLDRVSDIYLAMDSSQQYSRYFEKFKALSHKMSDFWNKYTSSRESLNHQLSNMQSESYRKSAYQTMQSNLKSNYEKYRLAVDEVKKNISKNTRLDELKKHEEKLKKFFRYQKHTKAQKQYKEYMLNLFGREISPEVWCDDTCPSLRKISKVITSEIHRKFNQKFQGLAVNLTAREFIYQPIIKARIAKELKRKGILIPSNFSYSYDEFSDYYDAAVSRKKAKLINDFISKARKQSGSNELKLNDSWNDFVRSQYVIGEISGAMPFTDKEAIKRIQILLITRDIGQFKDKVYIPSIKNKVDSFLFSSQEFENSEAAIIKGNDAIKLLYIPPFALALSMVALILNILTLGGMLLMLVPLKPIALRWTLMFGMFATVLVVPTLNGGYRLENKIIDLALENNSTIGHYVTVLSWLHYYQEINYAIHISNDD
jgi:hypothetical protein